jgi:transposase InsO family protein
LCNVSRQAHYQILQRITNELEKEIVFIRLMEQTREIHPGMGLRTMHEMLQPDGIGRDAFIALGLRSGFRLLAMDKPVRTTYSIKTNRYQNLLTGKIFTDVNQIWSSDITYFYCLERHYYLVMIMDVYSRRILGYNLSDNMRAEGNYEALKMAILTRGLSHYHDTLIHHSDKGSQYASDLYTQTLAEHGILTSMCQEVYENTHIERLNETIKNQYMYRWVITSETILNQKIKETIYTYNHHRPHQSLSKMSPVEFESNLKTVSEKDREKLEIFTIKKDIEMPDPNQLKLFNN